MQILATDVGGLKKVLSNVKLRGRCGGSAAGDAAGNRYSLPISTTPTCVQKKEAVIPWSLRLSYLEEVRMNFNSCICPIDAKFPKDAYEQLIAAYESVVPEDIEAASKNMEITIKKMAKDIRDKYIDPPGTTDFAIMFLPFESIYAEVIRRSALVDQLRDEFKISVAGPTTLLAILNSLQMGFRTLAIQKRSW